MTNEIKLLRAFIKASGYEIEEIKIKFQFDTGLSGGERFKMIDSIDYKVTKKLESEMTTKEWIKQNYPEHNYSKAIL